jgi:two-component system cell cycle sensor histidine kinase/response regulator CckA
MTDPADRRRLALATVLTVVIFLVDVALPRGYTAGVLYVLPVLIGLGGRSHRVTLAIAAAGALLVPIGYLLSSEAMLYVHPGVVNGGFALFAIGSAAFAVVTQQRTAQERAGATAALAESQERFRVAFEHAPVGVAVKSPEGVYLQVNQALCDMLGYRADELIGRSYRDITHPEDRHWEEHGTLLEQGHMTLEKRYLHKDGHAVWAEVTLGLVRDAEGQPSFVISQAHDVSAQRDAEQALRVSEERFRLAFAQAPTGMALRDKQGAYVQVNDSFLRMLRCEPGAVVGRCPWHFSKPAHAERLRRLDAELLDDGEAPRRAAIVLVDTEGGEHVTRVTSALVKTSSQEPLAFVDTVEDVTRERAEADRHKRLEEQLRRAQKLEAVGRLAGGIAHDFNNMLSIILNYAALAERRLPEGSPVRQDLAAVKDAGTRAASLTRQLLLFSGRHASEKKAIEVDATIATIGQLLHRTLGEDVELKLHLGASGMHVLTDGSHLEQVLMNLAVNARDAMPDGGTLRIETDVVEKGGGEGLSGPGRYVRITVSDTGMGMPPEVMARVFEPFYTTKPVGEGTGLGLAIVYGIVEQAGGQIDVESTLARGTTMRILLPAVDAPVPATLGPPRSSGSSRGRGEWVLVVEDEAALRELTARVLQSRGYRVIAAKDGVDALEKLEQHHGPLQLLLTDVVMPRMSGRELAARVSALRPDVRVLYVSGHAEDRIARHRLLHPGAALLSKPFHVDELLERVREVLDAGGDGRSASPPA